VLNGVADGTTAVLATWTICSENELVKNWLLLLSFSLQMILRQEYRQRERQTSQHREGCVH